MTCKLQSAFVLALRCFMDFTLRPPIHFQKYRVAPRLGTDNVRRRLLFRLDQPAPLAVTDTGLA